jgi:hypothetical protein
LLRIGVSAPYDPVHAVRAQTLPPYGVLAASRWGSSAAPGSHECVTGTCTRRETQTVSPGLSPATGRACAACGARATCIAEDTVHGSSVDGVCVPLDRYLQTSKHLQVHVPQRLKLVRNTPRTSCYCMDRTRWASHATPVHSARSYIPREHAAQAQCKRSHTEPLWCVPRNSPTGNRLHHGRLVISS